MRALLNDPIRDNRPNVPANRQYPLRGILKCSKCGRRLRGTTRNKARGASRFYGCRKDSGGCGGTWILANNLETFVVGLVVAVAESSDAIAMIQAESGVKSDELSALVTERDQTQSKLASLEDKWANNTISPEGYTRNLKAFQDALRAADDRIAAIRASSAFGQVDGSLMTAWGSLSDDGRRKIILSFVSEVTVAPRATRGGNRFDPMRARIVWRSSALAMAAGMDEWPWSDEPLGRNERPDANRFYCPEVVKHTTAMCVASKNVTDVKDEGVEEPAFVQDVVSTIHD